MVSQSDYPAPGEVLCEHCYDVPPDPSLPLHEWDPMCELCWERYMLDVHLDYGHITGLYHAIAKVDIQRRMNERWQQIQEAESVRDVVSVIQ